MPYVLRNKDTGELVAAVQKNGYKLDYYGAVWWHTEEEAISGKTHMVFPGQADGADQWETYRMDENKIKVVNVKLKNDPARRVFVDEQGVVTVQ